MKHLRWELRHSADPTCMRVFGGGGGGENNSPDTTNADNRAALQDAVQVREGSTVGGISIRTTTNQADAAVLNTLAGSIPDAVKAVTGAGSDLVKNMGGAVVDLTRDSIKANTKSFDSVVNFGAQAIDKLIDASTQTAAAGSAIAAQAVTAFKPNENANSDALKWGLIAAAGVAAAVILGKVK